MESEPGCVLAGLSILLVEDQMLIALDAEMMLKEEGAVTVASVMSSDEALKQLESATWDAGVLDINLGTHTSFPVAHAFLRLGVPFIFATGYGDDTAVAEPFQDIPRVTKPYSRRALADALVVAIANQKSKP